MSENVRGGETAAFYLLLSQTGILMLRLMRVVGVSGKTVQRWALKGKGKKENAAQNPQSWKDVTRCSQPEGFGIIAPSFLVEVRVNESSPLGSILLYMDIFVIEG